MAKTGKLLMTGVELANITCSGLVPVYQVVHHRESSSEDTCGIA